MLLLFIFDRAVKINHIFICSKRTLNLYFSSFYYSNQHGHRQIWMLYANVCLLLLKP